MTEEEYPVSKHCFGNGSIRFLEKRKKSFGITVKTLQRQTFSSLFTIRIHNLM